MPTDDVTPIRQQYLEIKRQYPDAILFFRLGDFYETFDEDAEITSRELDIVLTSRPVGERRARPAGGHPLPRRRKLPRASDRKRLPRRHLRTGGRPTHQGHLPAQGGADRDSGHAGRTGSLLPGDANNYLASVIVDGETGRVWPMWISPPAKFAVTELRRSRHPPARRTDAPAPGGNSPSRYDLACTEGIPGHPTPWPAWRFEPGAARKRCCSHFQAASLEGFGCKGRPLPIRAAGGILQYLNETQPAALSLLTSLTRLHPVRIHDPGRGHAPQPGTDRDPARRAGERLAA